MKASGSRPGEAPCLRTCSCWSRALRWVRCRPGSEPEPGPEPEAVRSCCSSSGSSSRPAQSRNTNRSSRFGSTTQVRTAALRSAVRPAAPGPAADRMFLHTWRRKLTCSSFSMFTRSPHRPLQLYFINGCDVTGVTGLHFPLPPPIGSLQVESVLLQSGTSCIRGSVLRFSGFCTVNMLKLFGSVRPSAARFGTAAAAAAQATGPQQEQRTFYEFRTYSIRPDQNSAFLKLTNEKIHLRTAHSQLIGYWTVEFGGLNQVFHIWQYDSYSQRAAVRAALAQDPCWTSEYISKALPLLTAQDSQVSYLVPWSRLRSPPQQGGVFELTTFQMRPGGPAVWGGAFQAAMSAHDAPGYGKLLGAFHSEFGPLNRVHALWWFQSADHRAECRHKAHTDARVVAAVRNSVAHLDAQRNQLMLPCPFSPMK